MNEEIALFVNSTSIQYVPQQQNYSFFDGEKREMHENSAGKKVYICILQYKKDLN